MDTPLFNRDSAEGRIQREQPTTEALDHLRGVVNCLECCGVPVALSITPDDRGDVRAALTVPAEALSIVCAMADSGDLRGWQPDDSASVPTWTRHCGAFVLRVGAVVASAAA